MRAELHIPVDHFMASLSNDTLMNHNKSLLMLDFSFISVLNKHVEMLLELLDIDLHNNDLDPVKELVYKKLFDNRSNPLAYVADTLVDEIEERFRIACDVHDNKEKIMDLLNIVLTKINELFNNLLDPYIDNRLSLHNLGFEADKFYSVDTCSIDIQDLNFSFIVYVYLFKRV